MTIDENFEDNSVILSEMTAWLDSLRNNDGILLTGVLFCGSASPEGSQSLNEELEIGRAAALRKFIEQFVTVPDEVVSWSRTCWSLNDIRQDIINSDIESKEEITRILDENPDNIAERIREIDGGKIWTQLYSSYFTPLRNSMVVFTTRIKPVQVRELQHVTAPAQTYSGIRLAKSVAPMPPEQEWSRRILLKSNAAALGLAIANVAAEVDIARHWSFSLPVYYSAWNYFGPKTKFRLLAFQPEIRWWLSESNDGFYAGAHFGAAWYNFATGGDWRIQDKDGRNPAIGGGLDIGYRMDLSGDGRWKIEFALGAGARHLEYDRFYNEPDGLLKSSESRTWWGLDNAAVSVIYTIGIKKGGAK